MEKQTDGQDQFERAVKAMARAHAMPEGIKVEKQAKRHTVALAKIDLDRAALVVGQEIDAEKHRLKTEATIAAQNRLRGVKAQIDENANEAKTRLAEQVAQAKAGVPSPEEEAQDATPAD